MGPLALAATVDDPERWINDQVATARDIPEQFEILARLAWPNSEQDARVAPLARQKMVEGGKFAMPALRSAVSRVHPKYRADVVRAAKEAFRNVESGVPPEYYEVLNDAMWFGTTQAKLEAVPELGRLRVGATVLALEDFAIEEPEALPEVVSTLGRIGDERARFFLERVLNEGRTGVREQAAIALARIGGQAMEPLRKATRSTQADVRLAAVRALIPVATVEEMTALQEYAAKFPSDDPATVKAAAEAAAKLEKVFEATRARESATPLPE
jgi:HEAT repeat protein